MNMVAERALDLDFINRRVPDAIGACVDILPTPPDRRRLVSEGNERSVVKYRFVALAGSLLLAVAGIAGCSSAAPTALGADPAVAAPAGKTWELAFDAEFEGTSLDTTKFTPCFDWNYGDCTSSFNDG